MDEVIVWWGVDFGRGIHWQIPFKALDGTSYQVNIYEEGYDGNVVVLKGGAQPFVTEETDDSDAFLPIRSSSGYISVICENAELVNQILPVNVHDRYVELYNATAQKTVWNGYILPSEFSGEWNVTPYELQLPVASPIAACQDLKYEGFMKAVTIGDALKKILYDQMKVAPSFIMSGKFPAQTASFLTAIFSDIQFAEVDSSPLSPAYGSGQNVEFGDEYTTIGEVLEAICKLYGYVLHETPDALWFCSSDMSTDYYQTEINYDPNDDYLQSETTIALSDVDMPDIAASYNERSLLPGKSKVRVYCEAEEVNEMWNIESEDLEQIDSSFYRYPENALFGEDEGFFTYTRYNGPKKTCAQYLSSDYEQHDPHPIYNTSIFNANRLANARNLFGANFISIAQWKKPDYIWPDEYDKYTNGLMLCQPENYYVGASVCLARIQSEHSYSAMNFLKNGIILSCKCVASKGWDKLNFKYKYDKGIFYIAIKWGDKYYIAGLPERGDNPSDGHWSDTPGEEGTYYDKSFFLLLDSYDSTNDEGTSELFKVNPSSFDQSDFFRQTVWDIRNARKILLREDEVRDVNGPITIEFWSYASPNSMPYLLLTDMHLDHVPFSYESLGDNTDHYLSDFRRNLSNSKAEEYEYEMVLNNMMASYSPSGVVPPATVQDTPADYFEQTILDRLSNWYDRTIEQLTVTVEYSNLSPGQRIEYDNSLYIVVSRADNWRDSNVTLTLQKMYEPQATN
jgi:hypothetical protein